MAERLSKALARYRVRTRNWHERVKAAHKELGAGTLSDPWNGLLRTFQMLEEPNPQNADNMPQIPPEEKDVQRIAADILSGISDVLAQYVNALITRDTGNMAAYADIVVDGEVVAQRVPAVALIAMENDFKDLVTLVREIPEAPAGEHWTYDENDRVLRSDPSETLRTAQKMKSIVTAPETDRHPAQVHVFSDNVPVAKITSVRYHGGMLLSEKRKLIAAAEKVFVAISQAREEANAAFETEPVTDIGERLVALALPGILT